MTVAIYFQAGFPYWAVPSKISLAQAGLDILFFENYYNTGNIGKLKVVFFKVKALEGYKIVDQFESRGRRNWLQAI